MNIIFRGSVREWSLRLNQHQTFALMLHKENMDFGGLLTRESIVVNARRDSKLYTLLYQIHTTRTTR